MNEEPEIGEILAPTDTEVADIITLYRLAGWWGDDPDDAPHVRRLVAGSHVFVAVRQGSRIVGMGRAISDSASDAYIQDVTVHPEWRGRGLGERIVRAVAGALNRDGILWIALIAENDSHGFYERLGFSPMPGSLPMKKLSHEI